MKRILVSGLGVAILLGVVGCEGGGIDEGVPKGDLQPQQKMDPKFMDMGGRSFKDSKTAQAKASASTKDAGTPAPTEEKK